MARETKQKAQPLAAAALRALRPGEWATDPGKRGEGSLQARRLASGAVWFYFRYSDASRTQHRIPLGVYDPDARPGDESRFTLATARDKARSLVDRYRGGDKDIRGTLAAEDDARRQQREAAEAAKAARENEAAATLGALLTAYCDSLDMQGKASARLVRSAIVKNAKLAHPKLWSKAASKIEPDDVLDIVETLTSEGKPREAAKMRSYVRAAFAAAINARTKPGALPALRKLKVLSNPARDVGTVPGSSKTRDRALSVAELRAYWTRIEALPEPAGAALRFHLLSGGQRIEQLARATTTDIDTDARALLLLDAKGRRSEPRRHWVPLLPEAEKCIETMGTPRLGAYVWSVSNGETPVSEFTIRDRVAEVCAAMLKDKETTERFTPGDIRRTVETRLAALGVGLEVRAHLQSHGLGGVQARHYDRHDYADEKRAALVKLRDLLTGKPATVSALRGRKGAR